MSEFKEYVVTLKNFDDLDNFYDDMETSGGSCHIPDREVCCYNRRPISRNTGYLLSNEEVDNLRNDSRVLDITPQEILDNVLIKPTWSQTSTDWDKSEIAASTNRNWGLYRCINGSQVSNWGSDGTVDVSGTITTTSSGKNVDVVIVDGHLDPSHPEFAKNSDGTGGSRVIQYNWYQHNSELGLGANGTYIYPTGSSLLNADDNHGMHVAGTVAGNTQGWARDANIYNISPYSTNPNSLVNSNTIFDYIRVWHNKKSINPSTGRKNPTIINNSWATLYSGLYALQRSNITSITYRGTTYTSPFTNSQLRAYGIVKFTSTTVDCMGYIISRIVDVEDAVDNGIIFVGGSANESTKIDVSGGNDYNNYITHSGFNYYYHRGSWNSAAARPGVGGQKLSICVGAMNSTNVEIKASFSNCGPRVDIYSPGVNIISSLHSNYTTNDFRNSSYKIGKFSGTSMASPQVCGVLACLLEQYPNMTQKDVEDYLKQHATKNQIASSFGGYTDNTDLQGSENLYLFYEKERPETGVSLPRNTYSSRKSSENGVKYPRVNTKFTKPI